MNDGFNTLDEMDKSELSEDDLAVLQAFEAMEHWPPAPAKADAALCANAAPVAPFVRLTAAITAHNDDEMFMIFANEAKEDIASMQQIIKYLEHEDHINPTHFVRLQRLGHKLYGTTGAVGFPVMSTIASQIEVIAEQITQGKIFPLIGIYSLSQAITALEHCLSELTSLAKEPAGDTLLTTLDATYRNLNIDVERSSDKQTARNNLAPTSREQLADMTASYEDTADIHNEKIVSVRITAPLSQERTSEVASYSHRNIRIDVKRFEKLTRHAEQLVELHTALEDAQVKVQRALHDLQAAQMRLQHLDPMISLLTTSSTLHQQFRNSASSSLITRIIHEKGQRHASLPYRQSQLRRCPATTGIEATWNNIDMERYAEKDLLVQSLKESIADVSLSTARLQAAHAHLATIQQEYASCAAAVRSSTLQMRQSPLSTLIPRLQRVVTMSALAQTQQVLFEVTGETTEIDQDTLEALAFPLVQLLRICIADLVTSTDGLEHAHKEPSRIWLHMREIGNEIILELGFSMTIQGGAIDAIGNSIRRLNGKISLQRNREGGISFFLHVPRLQGAVRCLLVHASLQKIVIPFSQIGRVVHKKQETFDSIYHLRDLLGFPPPATAILAERIQSVLVMQETAFGSIGIAVDEVVDEVELCVKPLKSYLQRLGIMGTTIDSKGSVALMIDLPALVKHYRYATPLSNTCKAKQDTRKPPVRQIRVLVVDDAVYLRYAVRQTLQSANYIVIEARDGIEAIEQLQAKLPDICLLDVEMPNLNGYDILTMVHQMPECKNMKVIMLTSHSSEKHRLHALELGAHACLMKPCPPETLLTTILKLLHAP